MSVLSERVRHEVSGASIGDGNLIRQLCDEYESMEAQAEAIAAENARMREDRALLLAQRDAALKRVTELEGMLREWWREEEKWGYSSNRYRFENGGVAAKEALMAEAMQLVKVKL